MAVVKKDPYAGAVTKPETERDGAAKESVKQPASTSAKVQQPAPAQNPAAASPSTGPSMEGTTYSKHLPAAPVVKRDTYTYDAVRPVYTSPYSTQIDDLLEAVMSREKFSYDLDSDPLYDQYHKQAVREGDRAMRDAMGNATALTGGYGSSYATTAGSQAYDYYLSQLNDRIPELERLAYSKYLQEGQDLYDQLAALQGLEADAYGKYRDQVGDFESDRAFDYGVWSDDQAQQNWQASFDYQKAQDALAQQNWERELAYQQEQDALAYALKLAQLQEEDDDQETNAIYNPYDPSKYQKEEPTSEQTAAYGKAASVLRGYKQKGMGAEKIASYLLTQYDADNLTEEQVGVLANQFGAADAMRQLMQ